MKDAIKNILARLVSYQSVTPHDAGCQEDMIHVLEGLGFQCQRMNNLPVANFFASLGQGSPCLMFAGHTDVVPIGDAEAWNTDPFVLHEKDGMFYGRGVADMKGSLACMLVCAARFVENHADFTGRLGFLITSGEEGDDYQLGTPFVMQKLHDQGIHPTYCIVGEPSSQQRIADVIKVGRRGSLNASLILKGKQGHVAYPHLAQNPIHALIPALTELINTHWDAGNAYFPPTSLQVTKLSSGGHANNIIPGDIHAQFNLRYSTQQTANGLINKINDCFTRHNISPVITWNLSGEPFLTVPGVLLEACIAVIQSITHETPELSTSGGTSDGRFIAPFGIDVVELGPCNATIHQVNECVAWNDLEKLTEIYYAICVSLLI